MGNADAPPGAGVTTGMPAPRGIGNDVDAGTAAQVREFRDFLATVDPDDFTRTDRRRPEPGAC